MYLHVRYERKQDLIRVYINKIYTYILNYVVKCYLLSSVKAKEGLIILF